MKSAEEALIKENSYKSDWIGGKGGNAEVTVGGDGNPAVGLAAMAR